MSEIIYITPEQAKVTHAKTIEYSGGGTLDELDFGKLENALLLRYQHYSCFKMDIWESLKPF